MNSPSPQSLVNTGLQHHQAGRLAEAEQHYLGALQLDPQNASALNLLGVANHQLGRHAEAVALIERAIALQPLEAVFHNNLGSVLGVLGRSEAAQEHLRRALQLNPNYAEAYNNLGAALKLPDHADEAIRCFQAAVRLRPDYAKAHNNLAATAALYGNAREAVKHGQMATKLTPDSAEAHCNLAVALHKAGELQLAAESCRVAVKLNPLYAQAWNNLGAVLRALGEADHAIAAFEKAIAIRPDYAEAHVNLALTLLGKGDFHGGWDEYEWRWRLPDQSAPRASQSKPLWDGSPLNGRTILLDAEQGIGDTIQFVRYVPPLLASGAKVILRCQCELKTLLAESFESIEVVGCDQQPPADSFDVSCSMMSLPRLLLRTRAATIPADIPYLRGADPSRVRKFKDRMASDGIHIGLAWAGNPANTEDATRSIPPELLAPLSELPGVNWYSLQKEVGQSERRAPPALKLIDWTQELTDFSQTAALVTSLDCVISVDTAVAHLTGALGKRGCILLSRAPHFSWMMQGEQSPWYPTLRLFRQLQPGDWAGVVSRVLEELKSSAVTF